jgi:hypothetical protein
MRIGIIGSGNIGGAIARRLAPAGHELLLASRHPEALEGLAAELGEGARTGTVAEAAAFGEVVVLAIPYGALGGVREEVGDLEGKVLVDVTNYYAERDGIELSPTEPTSAVVARAFPGARVVKAFNTIYYRRLEDEGRPPGPDQLALPVAADDPEAKGLVSELVTQAGFAPVDAGSLAESHRQEPGTPVYNEPLTAAQIQEALA